MKIVFADVDGCLNTHFLHPIGYTTIDKDKAALFNQILYETGAYFVLSSAWRYLLLSGSMNLDGLQNLLLSHWVEGRRLVGVTREDISVEESDRGKQITDWLCSHLNISSGKDFKYVVIDDLDLGISAADHPFIHVDGKIGLTEEHVEEAIRLLS